MFLGTIEALVALLASHQYYANGKNQPAAPLHETVAESRWAYENLLAVYLAKPTHVWMAVWMAVTRRDRLKKRQLRYLRPTGEDALGRIEIYNPDGLAVRELLCESAHLYLFDTARFAENRHIDLLCDIDKVTALARHGFRQQRVARRGWVRDAFVPDSGGQCIVHVDEWQVAAVNYGTLTADQHVVLGNELIGEMMERVTFRDDEVGENYLA